MRTTPIKRRILNVMAQYKDRPYLTVSEIAGLAYGSAYIRDTRRHLDSLVRRNIYSVMDLAVQNDMIIIPVKKRNTDTGDIEKKILGYKIAGKEDQEYISMYLEDKEKRANAFYLAFSNTVDDLTQRKLLPEGEYQLKLMQG